MKVPRLLSRLCLAAALLLGGCGSKNDPLGAAKQFFQQIAAGQTIKELGLDGFTSAEWETPEIIRREARVPVKVRTKSNTTLSFVVTLVEESRIWRVYALRSPKSEITGRSDNQFSLVGKGAAFSDALSRPLPDEKETKALSTETLLMFNDAIQQKSFADFYDRVSLAWQKQLTQGQLQRAFQPFIEKQVDLSGIRGVEAVIDSPPTMTVLSLSRSCARGAAIVATASPALAHSSTIVM